MAQNYYKLTCAVDEGQPKRCRVYVVGRLREIDVIVRVAVFIIPTFESQDLQRPVGYDLVGVHVRGCAGSPLDHIHDKVRVKPAIDDFLRCLKYRGSRRVWKQPKLTVGSRSCEFHLSQSHDKIGEVTDGDLRNRKILSGPQRLNSIIELVWDVASAQQIMFWPSAAGDVLGGVIHDLVSRLAHAPGDDTCRSRQNLACQRRLWLHQIPQRLARESEHHRVFQGAGGCRVRIFIHEGAFTEKIASLEHGQAPFLPECSFFEEFNTSFVNNDQVLSRCILLKENLPFGAAFETDPFSERGPFAIGQFLEEFYTSKKFIQILRVHRSTFSMQDSTF